MPAGDSIRNSQSHSLEGVAEMVATAADATVSNVIGMIGAEAGLSVKNAAMKATTPQCGARHVGGSTGGGFTFCPRRTVIDSEKGFTIT